MSRRTARLRRLLAAASRKPTNLRQTNLRSASCVSRKTTPNGRSLYAPPSLRGNVTPANRSRRAHSFAIQLPCRPCGTRCGSRTTATGSWPPHGPRRAGRSRWWRWPGSNTNTASQPSSSARIAPRHEHRLADQPLAEIVRRRPRSRVHPAAMVLNVPATGAGPKLRGQCRGVDVAGRRRLAPVVRTRELDHQPRHLHVVDPPRGKVDRHPVQPGGTRLRGPGASPRPSRAWRT